MSDDLVERLRAEGIAELDEAANRIEKLEAALAHIYSWYPISVTGPLQTIHEIRDFARKALEGKDD
ncbi:hypothetical protein UFOVP1417_35 [uncultured Caudovirales phage]|uniref:Uncharacterized protein n=1 Tax=uncultured Caudovirales phage TaxID=2100421 RepID=A0A6J5RMI2_9CAUD|nr:hypothetical protein UFOVP664_52 [uncultured Caudovirales phage]CAB4195526.1 hypothetical protein UFOVP1303_19 [uncultured Caudovirales phage]CAB4210703.1 hypothetical protein UFOVP1417_35 [uncultured Caudovirales phage]CAB5226938.1 hypothetical protein UFOVP1517_76 [uncultured Caudovirales phage]